MYAVTRNVISKHTFLIYLHELITQSKNLTKRIVYLYFNWYVNFC